VVVLSLVIAVPVGAKKPAPKLVGDMVLSFTPPDLVPNCYGIEGSVYNWRGTVTFDELPGDFGMTFVNLGTGKAFDSTPESPFPPGVVSFFTEIWAIYDGAVDLDDTGCPDISAATIWGYDSGVSNWNNFTYRMNGEVDTANGVFAGWEGRKVHMSGTFDIALDDDGNPVEFFAPGTFRLN
jgi:hypothetical protein